MAWSVINYIFGKTDPTFKEKMSGFLKKFEEYIPITDIADTLYRSIQPAIYFILDCAKLLFAFFNSALCDLINFITTSRIVIEIKTRFTNMYFTIFGKEPEYETWFFMYLPILVWILCLIMLLIRLVIIKLERGNSYETQRIQVKYIFPEKITPRIRTWQEIDKLKLHQLVVGSSISAKKLDFSYLEDVDKFITSQGITKYDENTDDEVDKNRDESEEE